MDAPTYPPAAAFEQPASAAYVISLQNSSLAELMSMPVAWDIVLKHMPRIKMGATSAMIKPHLGNFTVLSLASFGMGISPEAVAAANEELAQLPPVQGSVR